MFSSQSCSFAFHIYVETDLILFFPDVGNRYSSVHSFLTDLNAAPTRRAPGSAGFTCTAHPQGDLTYDASLPSFFKMTLVISGSLVFFLNITTSLLITKSSTAILIRNAFIVYIRLLQNAEDILSLTNTTYFSLLRSLLCLLNLQTRLINILV